MEEQREKKKAPHCYSFIQRATLQARFTELNAPVAPVKSQVADESGIDKTEQREKEEVPHYCSFIQTATPDVRFTELKALVTPLKSQVAKTQQGQAPLGSDTAAAQQQHGGVGPRSRSLQILGFCKPTDSWVDETKGKAPNSDSASQRTDQVSHLRCHFPELKSQLALVRYPELSRSPGNHRPNDEQEEEEEEEVPLGSHPVASLSDLSSTGSSITNFGGPPSPVGPLPSPPQSMTSESIPTPPPSPIYGAPAEPEPFILGSILNVLDDVPSGPGDSPRMDPNDENDPHNPWPQKENSVCCCFLFPRRGV